MTNPMIRIHNAETNEVVDRPMNEEEFGAYQTQQTLANKWKIKEAEKATAKAALLERLGITADEANLLLS